MPATVAIAGGLLLAASLAGPAAAADPTVSVIASGLDNPRGIAVGANGRVFVAEAGRGGAGGYGRSGRIVVIAGGTTRTFTGGLPSAISDEGEVTGPVGVDLRADGTAVATVGIGPRAADRRFGSLLRLSPRPGRVIADIQAFRDSHPDATDIDQPPNPTDSNAYGVAVLGGSRTLVTDAGGNDLLLVSARGRVTTVAKFPNALVSTS
ncbi:MAG: ScyD/ScyE family protein, partial [Chloroflexi bacterium]|nr:ScyD/ScyE family protein [Chloroflexota bacterium]